MRTNRHAPERAATDIQDGYRAWHRGDVAAALTKFQALLTSQAHLPDVWQGLGFAHWSLRSFDNALAAFTKACSLEPHNPAHWSNIGLCLRELGQTERATNVFQAAIHLNPMFAPAYNEWANVLLDVHEESSAYPLYQKALALDDTRAVYHHNIGLCCRRMGWEAEAEKHLLAALERDAAYAHSLEELGEIHLQRGDKERGMSLLHRANTPRAALLLQEWESPFTSDEQESENDCVVVLPHFLTTRECQHLRQAMDAAPLEWPTTSKRDASGYEVDLSRRRVFRAEVAASVNRMVRDRLESAAPMLAARFGAAVHGIEAPQLLRYETGHFFSYHQDVGDNSPGNNSRRVAIVVGLNGASRSSYRGGLLRLFKSEAAALQGKPIWQERVAEGTLVAFLATAFHDVTRVTSGRRYVSVSWLVGSGSDLLRSGDAAVRERADR